MSFDWNHLATRYHDEVISPFARGVEFRLEKDLDERLSSWERDGTAAERVAIDFGCGCGEALLLLAGRVGLSAGFDGSEGMLVEAQRLLAGERAIHAPVGGWPPLRKALNAVGSAESSRAKTLLVKGDLRRLGSLRESVDLALAINSICPSTTAQAVTLFRNISGSVRPGGELIAVWPSYDTMEHLFRLFRASGQDPSSVGTLRPEGVFVSDVGAQQKYATADEITSWHEEAGFEMVRLEKICYPWPLVRESGWGFFPGRPRIWDWYSHARRMR